MSIERCDKHGHYDTDFHVEGCPTCVPAEQRCGTCLYQDNASHCQYPIPSWMKPYMAELMQLLMPTSQAYPGQVGEHEGTDCPTYEAKS